MSSNTANLIFNKIYGESIIIDYIKKYPNLINQVDDEGNTLLHYEVSDVIFDTAIKAGIDLNKKNKKNWTILTHKIHDKNMNQIKKILQPCDDAICHDINTKYIGNNAILHFITSKSFIPSFYRFNSRNIRFGYKTFVEDDDYSYINYDKYSDIERLELLQLCLENGADPNIENDDGLLPIDTHGITSEMEQLLIQFGSKIKSGKNKTDTINGKLIEEVD